MNKDYLLQNENYAVRTGEVSIMEEVKPGYQVYNLKTDIVEYETTILPEAYHWARQLNDDLNNLQGENEVDKVLQ